MAIQLGLSELSVISWVSAIEGCPLSGVPLYNERIGLRLGMKLVLYMYSSVGSISASHPTHIIRLHA